jgi:Kef-type K+ transport system membrane component KefB
MEFNNILFELVLIYAGAAILATVFIFIKQPVILSYIILGIIIGPYGLKLISDAEHIEQIGHFGVILLLFLVGLNLHPNKLYMLFRKTSILTITTCSIFALSVTLTALAFQIPLQDSIIIGIALMFSSTVIGLKLIPTTALHNRHIGEMMISVLLFQDIIAIFIMLMFLKNPETSLIKTFPILILKGVLLSLGAFLCVKYVLLWLFKKFDTIQEYIFLLSIGWCLGMAKGAEVLGLSYEIGAFIAGVTIAVSPVSLIISERLKSLREFFIILFFFAIGAQFNIFHTKEILMPAIVITILLIVLKPFIFGKAFNMVNEKKHISKELAWRLGQASEFSLLIAYIALDHKTILENTSYLIQLTVMLTFIISTYIIVNNYHTPISANKKFRSD